jgi:hypothetical protein
MPGTLDRDVRSPFATVDAIRALARLPEAARAMLAGVVRTVTYPSAPFAQTAELALLRTAVEIAVMDLPAINGGLI